MQTSFQFKIDIQPFEFRAATLKTTRLPDSNVSCSGSPETAENNKYMPDRLAALLFIGRAVAARPLGIFKVLLLYWKFSEESPKSP